MRGRNDVAASESVPPATASRSAIAAAVMHRSHLPSTARFCAACLAATNTAVPALRYQREHLRRLFWQMRGREVVHFLHVGKTGGTAIKTALEPYCVNEKYALVLHAHDTTLSDVPAGCKIVFFLRDPVDRFVSGFYSRMRQGAPRYRSPWTPGEEEAFRRFRTPNELGHALSSRDPVVRLAACKAMREIQHVNDHYYRWFHSYGSFLRRFGDILFVGRQETLATDFEELRRRLMLPDDAALPMDDIGMHKNLTTLDKNIDLTAHGNLQEWYRTDYEFVALCESEFRALASQRTAVG